MKRKLVFLVTALMLVFCINSYAEEAEYVITAYDESGAVDEGIVSGRLTFEAVFKSPASDVSLIVVVYKNDEIVDFAVAEKLLPHSEDQTRLTVQAEIPGELSGCRAVAMLWDGLFTMDALCDEFVWN